MSAKKRTPKPEPTHGTTGRLIPLITEVCTPEEITYLVAVCERFGGPDFLDFATRLQQAAGVQSPWPPPSARHGHA